MLCWIFLQHRLNYLRNNEVEECSVAEYSISVNGLPSNTTVEELVRHFSNLYPLDRPDWKGRPGILFCKPVTNISNTGNPEYINSWVSECILHKRIGGFLSAFKYREGLLNKLRHSRAQMKMYSENTPHAHGPNLQLYEKAEKQMLLASMAIENVVKRKMKENLIKFKKADFSKDPTTSQIIDPQYNIDADVIRAFICFEYTESMARCIQDYQHYSEFPWSLAYPRALKFRGRKIQVSQASDPEEIAWENLGKFLLR